MLFRSHRFPSRQQQRPTPENRAGQIQILALRLPFQPPQVWRCWNKAADLVFPALSCCIGPCRGARALNIQSAYSLHISTPRVQANLSTRMRPHRARRTAGARAEYLRITPRLYSRNCAMGWATVRSNRPGRRSSKALGPAWQSEQVNATVRFEARVRISRQQQ